MQDRNGGQWCYLRGFTQDEENIGQINIYMYIQKAVFSTCILVMLFLYFNKKCKEMLTERLIVRQRKLVDA